MLFVYFCFAYQHCANEDLYSIVQDIQTIRELNDLSQDALAKELSVAIATIERWESDNIEMSATNMENFYTYAFKSNVALNKIKAQLYREEFTNEHQLVLFHGAKSELGDNLQLQKSKVSNDFGQGFYIIRRFMNSSLCDRMDKISFLYELITANQAIEEINEEYGISTYGKTRYSKDELFWTGYILRYTSYVFEINSRHVYKLIKGNELRKLYLPYHTLDPLHAID